MPELAHISDLQCEVLEYLALDVQVELLHVGRSKARIGIEDLLCADKQGIREIHEQRRLRLSPQGIGQAERCIDCECVIEWLRSILNYVRVYGLIEAPKRCAHRGTAIA